MKKMKKMMALVLAVAMCLAMSMTTTVMSFAADGHKISLKSTDTHTYKVFQVLTGTLAEAGSKELGNPAWGADAIANPGDVNAFIASLKDKSEQDVAQLVAAKVDTNKGQGTVDKDNPLENLATGYYVLVDITDLDDDSLETKSLHVVRVVNDINGFDPKWGTTQDDKKIVSDTLGKDSGVNNFNPATDTDNVSIGDTVNFKITATVPANADKYNYFYFVINDTLDPGLTLTPSTIAVYKGSVAEANKLALTTDYLVKTGADAAPKDFQVGLVDAKSHAGETIIVTYSAVLNENAEIGETANKNTSTVDFSNDPNHDYDGEHYPGFPDQKENNYMGETPKSVTETYTTSIQIQKVDENGKVLTGAEFTITGDSTEIVLVSSETFAADAAGTYYKLKNDSYTTEAPTADKMEEAQTGATAGYVVAETGYTGDDKVVIDGTTYRPYVPETDSGKTLYILVKGTADQYDSTTTKYKKTVNYTQKDTTGTDAVEAKAMVGADGVVEFRGLGAGTYTISESKTPSGYNTLPDLTVTVGFDKDETPKWSFSGGTGSYDSQEGIYKITIENQKGTELPSTGGMGTTIFYIAGAILVIGAVVLLIARKKAER